MYESENLLPPAPPSFTLNDALQKTSLPNGSVKVGYLTFSAEAFQMFEQKQRELGGTPDQLAVLHQLTRVAPTESSGRFMFAPPSEPPAGTTVEHLLSRRSREPDQDGYYALGTLRVPEADFEKFAELQRTLAHRGSTEALALLYHMQNATDRPVKFHVTNDDDRNSRYGPGENTIYWHPYTGARDEHGATVSPSTAALHETTHWAGRRYAETLKRIPMGLGTFEEMRVMNGAEARDQRLQGRAIRSSYVGHPISVADMDSITPTFSFETNGIPDRVQAPWRTTGRIVHSNQETTAFDVRNVRHNSPDVVILRTSELKLMVPPHERPAFAEALAEAALHRDIVTVQLTRDGRVMYHNEQQARRQHLNAPSMPDPSRRTRVARGR